MAQKRASGGAPEERMAVLKEDAKEGKSAEKYNAVGSKTVKEADDDGYGGHKRGGRAKKAAGGAALATGGAVARKNGGKVHHGSMPMHVDGKAPKHHRLDRPGRKSGGGIGADRSPMTAAARLTAPKGEHDQTKTDMRDD